MKTGYTHRFAIGATVLLTACSRGGAEDPSVVLERASTTAQQSQSAAFDARFSYDAGERGMRVDASTDGMIADGGRQMSFSFDADVTTQQEGVDRTVSAAGDVIVAGENEAYVRLSKVDGSVPFLPGIGLVSEEALDTWYQTGEGQADPVSLSPDPSFIAMQTRVLTVTDDRSYEQVDGHDCYAYDVEIDPEKALGFLRSAAEQRGQPFDAAAAETFLSSFVAHGTMWIDAETFVIRRIEWTFGSAPQHGDMQGTFGVHFDRHGEQVEIAPPVEFSPLSDILSAVSLPTL